MLPWLLCSGLAVVIVVLLVKLWLLRRSLDEMVQQLGDRLSQNTNSPIFLSVRDAHARRLASELNLQLKRLRRQRQRYQQGDAELKDAVASISHDLRTPLTAIWGYTDLLEREELPENAKRYLGQIRNRMEAMTKLTEELFCYSLAAGQKELNPEPVDLRRILEESLMSFYAAMTQRGIRPDISLPEGAVVRMLDPSALGRIFGNIISNALKYSSGDFTAVLEENGAAVFSNSVQGLDPVSAARLFDRFYTVETGRGATGLGLSIAKALTERQGGRIQADVREGRLFITVCFPGEWGRS